MCQRLRLSEKTLRYGLHERQNKRILAGNKFISNIAGREYIFIYPKDIMQGTSVLYIGER